MSQAGSITKSGSIPAGTYVETLTGNSGGAVSPDGVNSNINIVGAGIITVTGNPGTNTLTISGSGEGTTITGDTGGALSPTAGNWTFTGGTTGLTFAGATSTETLTGTLVVGNGGTGATTFTSHGVLLGNTTSAITATAAGTTGQVLTGVTGSAPTFQAPAASSISITGDSGGALTGNAFTFTGGTTGLTFAGSGTTETVGGTLKLANGGTNANLTASNGGIFYSTATAGAILAGTATANQVLLSGSSTTPAWSTATYPATTTINQLLYSSAANTVGGVTAGNYGVLISSSAGVPSWLANGTTGQVLTATTSGTPSWAAAAGGITTINGNSGSVTGSTITLEATRTNCGNTVVFKGSSATMDLYMSDSSNNTNIGGVAGHAGSNNTSLGQYSQSNITGSGNVSVGYGSMYTTAASNNNCAIGINTLYFLTGGGSNVAIGLQAGYNYTGSESSNILFGYNTKGTLGESNVLRIGNATGTSTGNLNAAYICGIQGITVTGSAVLVSSSDQLGIAVSSRKYKDNIQDMGGASEALYKLRPTTFTYKESTETRYGLIAEEVAEVLPNLVVYDKSGDPQTVMYHELPALLLNEIQKLRKEIDELKKKVGE